MKLPVRIITGFLEAGKTSYIHRLLLESNTSQRILILSFEEGIEEYKIEERQLHSVRIQCMDTLNELDEGFLRNCGYLYDEMIIEYNGIWMMSDLLDRLCANVHIQEIICLLDGSTYERYLPNIPAVSDQLMNCDRLIITHLDEKESAGTVKRALRPLRLQNVVQWLPKAGDCSVIGWTRMQKRTALITVLFLLFLVISLASPSVSSADLLQYFRMFFSIVLEVLPFLLTGILVSSLIQVFVSEDFFLQLLKLPKWAFVPLLLLSGCLLPLCDCAMVPLSEKLIQKGLPVSLGVMFLCISSAINPIILLSTYYAFPQQPELIVFRLVGSILIALLMGLAFHNVQRNEAVKQQSSLLEDRIVYEVRNLSKGTLSRWSLVFQNMGEEVLRIMMYVFVGALLSALVQLAAKSSSGASLLHDRSFAMISMLLASFLLSICATSNAFVAKAFANSVPIANAASFMLFGPLLDSKNLLMLSSRFQRRFMIRYVSLLVILYGLISGLTMLVLS